MAAVTQKLTDGDRIATFRFVNADTDETTATTKVDISDSAEIDPGGPNKTQPTSLRILRMWYNTGTNAVSLLYGATANQLIWTMAASHDGYLDFRCAGGLPPADTGAAGFTGDFLLQVDAATTGPDDGYSMIVEFEKRYD